MATRRGKQVPSLAGGFYEQKADYNAARSNRFRRIRTGITLQGSGADYHYRSESDYLRMMEYARDMDRNDAVTGTMLDRAVTNTIQSGLTPEPQTGDEELNEELRQRWNNWADDPRNCDAAGVLPFNEIQEHSLRAALRDGDIFALPLEEGSLQIIEAHRCRTPSNTRKAVVHGVKLGAKRQREQFWFTREDLSPHSNIAKVSDTTQIPAFDEEGEPNVFHMLDPKRVSQTRGVTALAPVFDVASQFEDLQFAKLVQAQIVSCIGFIRHRDPEYQGGTRDQYGPRTDDTIGSAKRLLEEIAPGIEIEGEPGENITSFSPNTPNPEYFQHARMILTLLGINLGLPLVLITMDGSETNFSGWRGAVDQARQGFMRNQRWLRDRLCRPTYRWKVRQWIAEDTALRRMVQRREVGFDKALSHKWHFPGWRYIEPMKDAQADALRIEKRLSSPRRVLNERGIDYRQEMVDLVEDHKHAVMTAMAAADEIEQQYPNRDIDWHELLELAGSKDIEPAGASADDADEADDPAPGRDRETQPKGSLA